jgi:tRNA threonylcarbamoyladenosine biosynthesis protein TsaE
MISETFAGDADRVASIGGALAPELGGGDSCHLSGPLGAGKTTLVRGLLRALGHKGPVPSPTFTLVETYEFRQLRVVHFDLFRVESYEELETIGLRDYFADDNLCVFEWPDRGQGLLPAPRLLIEFDYHGDGRLLTITRNPTVV